MESTGIPRQLCNVAEQVVSEQLRPTQLLQRELSEQDPAVSIELRWMPVVIVKLRRKALVSVQLRRLPEVSEQLPRMPAEAEVGVSVHAPLGKDLLL